MGNGQRYNIEHLHYSEMNPTHHSTTHHSTINDSCGTCPACTKAQQLVHPDIHFSYPVVTKNQELHPSVPIIFLNGESLSKAYPYGNVYDWLAVYWCGKQAGQYYGE